MRHPIFVQILSVFALFPAGCSPSSMDDLIEITQPIALSPPQPPVGFRHEDGTIDYVAPKASGWYEVDVPGAVLEENFVEWER